MYTDAQLRDGRLRRPTDALRTFLAHDLGDVEGIAAAAETVRRQMPGYVTPAAHGSGIVAPSGSVSVEVLNRAGHDLPAMLLACICGHVAGTECVALSEQQLALAISVMAPAEACRAFQHPNLAAWRRILERLHREPAQVAVAVFIDDARWSGSNPIIQAFLGAS